MTELEYVEQMIVHYKYNFSQLGKEENEKNIKTLNSIKQKLEAFEILSRAIEFVDEGDFQSGHLNRVIFNDMVDDKEKSILERAFKGGK